MDSEFYQIFESLYDLEGARFDLVDYFSWRKDFEPRALPGTSVVRAFVDDAVAQFEAEKGRTVRPDAKLWLLINFRDLILIPLLQRYPARAAETLSRIQNDLRTILGRLSDTVGEISAHATLQAVATSWSELQSVEKDW